MKQIIANSFSEAEQVFKNIHADGNEFGFHTFYRGVSKSNYDLLSKLSRRKINGILDLQSLEVKICKSAEHLTEINPNSILSFPSQLKQFEREWYLLTQLQHLEIPTRLMDWTARWQRALTFALWNPKHKDDKSCVWCLKLPCSFLVGPDDLSKCDLVNLIEPSMINIAGFGYVDGITEISKIAYKRKSIQCGWFFIQSFEDSLIPIQNNAWFQNHLTKVIIPIIAREETYKDLCKVDKSYEEIMIGYSEEVEAFKKNISTVSGIIFE